MGIGASDDPEHTVNPIRQIISEFVSEDVRLARTTNPAHLQLLGTDLGVRRILTRPMTGAQEQHPGIEAMLVPSPEGYSVLINEKAPATRKNFSLAHELGHIMVMETDCCNERLPKATRFRSAVSANDEWKAEERLCDEIAAELLMPERMFLTEIEELGRSFKQLPELANAFGTSLTATAIRYCELLPEPCLLIRWRPSAKNRDVILPTWHNRNKFKGPSICAVTASSIRRRDEFRTLRETWRTARTIASRETLLVRYAVDGRRRIRPLTFETESLGFGGQDNRTVLSAVYLSRTHEGV